MLRSLTLSFALAGLAAACLTVAPPTSEAFVLRIQVFAGRPVELTVTTPDGPLPGAVLPAVLPKGSTTDVAFYLPVDDIEWWIAANGTNEVPREELEQYIQQGCGSGELFIRFIAGGSLEYGCLVRP